MERVLVSDRSGTWIWAHTGWLPVANPSLLRPLLQAHPNLFCELSGRESIRRIYRGDPIDNDRVLKPEWEALLEDFPDRFVIGTDVDPPTIAAYAEEIGTLAENSLAVVATDGREVATVTPSGS